MIAIIASLWALYFYSSLCYVQAQKDHYTFYFLLLIWTKHCDTFSAKISQFTVSCCVSIETYIKVWLHQAGSGGKEACSSETLRAATGQIEKDDSDCGQQKSASNDVSNSLPAAHACLVRYLFALID